MLFKKRNATGKIAVVLIDMQVRFVPNVREDRKPSLIDSQKKILAYCAEHDVPVCIVEFAGYGETISDLHEILKKIPRTKIVEKYEDDAFSNPELKQTLSTWGVNTLLLMGINADYCVKKTAASAIQNKFRILTAPSLISGQRKHSKDDSIEWYAANGTVVEDALSVIV